MSVQVFNFDQNQVRTQLDGEVIWFNANDVCGAIGFSNPHKALGDHVDEDDLTKREVIDNLGRAQLTNHVNESGLYALILGSTLPSAKVFKRWVTSEVLPAIRKTGKYAAKDPFKAGQTGIYNELELDKFERLANLSDMTRLERVPAIRALMAGETAESAAEVVFKMRESMKTLDKADTGNTALSANLALKPTYVRKLPKALQQDCADTPQLKVNIGLIPWESFDDLVLKARLSRNSLYKVYREHGWVHHHQLESFAKSNLELFNNQLQQAS